MAKPAEDSSAPIALRAPSPLSMEGDPEPAPAVEWAIPEDRSVSGVSQQMFAGIPRGPPLEHQGKSASGLTGSMSTSKAIAQWGRMSQRQVCFNSQVGTESIAQWESIRRMNQTRGISDSDRDVSGGRSVRGGAHVGSASKVSHQTQSTYAESESVMADAADTANGVAGTAVDLFDPAAPSSMLRRHALWQHYLHEPVEDEFVAFVGGNHWSLTLTAAWTSVLCAVVGILSDHDTLDFVTSAMGMCHTVFAFWSVYVAYSHYRVCIAESAPPPRLIVWWRSTATKEPRIAKALVAECHGILLCLSYLWLSFDERRSKGRCTKTALLLTGEAPGFESELSANFCRLGIGTFMILCSVGPMMFFTVRCYYSILFALLLPTLWMMDHLHGFLMGDVDNYHETSLKALVQFGFALFLAVGFFLTENFHRRRFEAWVILKRRMRRLQARLDAIDQSLRALLPPGSLAKLLQNQPVVDVSNHSSISVCQLSDFVQWSCSVLPGVLVETIDAMFVAFDVGVPRFGLDKVRTIGDRYIVSHGLQRFRRLESSGGDTSPIVHLSLWQLALAEQLSGLLSAPFEVQIGICTGPCFGGIIGTQSLWYEVYGEACDKAILLAQCCPPSSILVSEATRIGYQDAFVESEFDTGGGPIAYIIEGICREFDPSTCVDLQDATALESTAPSSVEGQSEPLKNDATPDDSALKHLDDSRRAFLLSRLKQGFGSGTDGLLTHRGSQGKEEWSFDDIMAVNEEVEAIQRHLHPVPENFTWDLSFPAEFEDSYDDNSKVIAAVFRPAIGLTVSGLAALLIFCTWVEGKNTLVSSGALLLTVLVDIGSAAVIPKVRKSTSAVLTFARSMVLGTLFYAGAVTANGISIVNARMFYLYILLQYILLFGAQRESWKVTAATATVFTWVTYLVFWVHASVLHRGMVIAPFGVCLVVMVFAYSSEKNRRSHYRDVALSRAIVDSTKGAYVLQRTMLSMLVPVSALKQVREKIQHQGAAKISSLGFVSVCACRIDGFLPAQLPTSEAVSLLRRIENHFDTIEGIIASLARRSGVAKIHAVGDSVLIGGPLVGSTWERRMDEVSLSVSTNMLPVGENAIRAACGVLDVAHQLKKIYRNQLTAVFSCGSAVSAIIGYERPTFELLGPLTRTVTALQQAAPSGFCGASEQFLQLLHDHNVNFPRRPDDFEIGTPQKWRMRGAGVIIMYPLSNPVTDERPAD